MVFHVSSVDRSGPRRRPARWALGIAATGFVLPYVVLFATWLVYAAFGIDPRASARLLGLLAPHSKLLPGIVVFSVLQAVPYLVQAVVAWRLLSSAHALRRGSEWRIAGCYIGLCTVTVVTYALVVPGLQGWRTPGLAAPLSVFAYLYGGGLVAGAIGGLIGSSLWRTSHHHERFLASRVRGRRRSSHQNS